MCRGPDCLCVCLERLLLGPYQPSSLSGLRLIASGQTLGADNSQDSDSVQRAEWRPSEPVTKHTEETRQLAKTELTKVNHGALTQSQRTPHHIPMGCRPSRSEVTVIINSAT